MTDETILLVRSLSHHFGGLVAVKSLDLDVRRGGVHAIIGPNGAGKSTVINLLSGALNLTSGTIALDGKQLAGRAAHVVAQAGIARTFQNGRLFGRLSVLENVLIGADVRYKAGFAAAIFRNGAQRAEEAGMQASAFMLLETLGMAAVAERAVTTLSYGNQRKLEIARALMIKPKLLLLDEPAAGLSSAEVETLISLIERLRRDGLTVILIEHNMGFVMRLADRISVLNFGEKIAEGAPREISENDRVIEAYLGRCACSAVRV
jgi:branched-chain amino acid transport system ATP-binding protein